MPNRRVHVATSTPGGAGYAFYKASDQNGLTKLPEVLGGLLPDQIEPPFHSGHRSIGHGFFPVGAAAISWNHYLDSWQSRLRQLAEEHSNHRSHRPGLARIRGIGPPFAIRFPGRHWRGIHYTCCARLRNSALLAAGMLKGHSYVD